MNNVGIGIEELINIYLSELQMRHKQYHVYHGRIIIVIIFLYIVFYFIIASIHKKILFRKENYFSLFYDISLSFIKSSMIKCEIFISKINPNELLISETKKDDIEESISFSYFNDEFVFNELNQKFNNKNILNNQIKKNVKFK